MEVQAGQSVGMWFVVVNANENGCHDPLLWLSESQDTIDIRSIKYIIAPTRGRGTIEPKRRVRGPSILRSELGLRHRGRQRHAQSLRQRFLIDPPRDADVVRHHAGGVDEDALVV